MTISERYKRTIDYFQKAYPEARTELEYTDPFGLIVAVILSAQCTDKRVNMITPPLLEKYPDAESMSLATTDEIKEFIKSCTYPNSKARYLLTMSKKLVAEYNGKVPSGIDELQSLPGVGRKTANVVASVVYRKPVLAVDTHVFRVANRIGLARNARKPLSVEQQLTKHIPESLIPDAHHWLILHGRYICKARAPLCSKCGLTGFCQYYSQLHKLKGRNR